MGELTVIVPIDCPVMVWVRLAIGLITVVRQGSGTEGAESVFLQPSKEPVNSKAAIKNERFFMNNKITIK